MTIAPTRPNGTSRAAPLSGVTVIEVSAYVATPLAGLTLAQLGADVIRVEPMGGQTDRTRMPVAADGTSMYWAGLNKGKRAVEVDLRLAEGRGLIANLVKGSGPQGGIVVTNTTKLPELAPEALRKLRPDLIHVLLNGRRDGSTGVDYTVQASVGLHEITGPLGTAGPVNDVLPFWDITSGLYLATAVLAAERHRMLTGEGQSVVVALQDIAMSALGNLGYLTEAQVTGVPRGRAGNYVYGTFGRDFATSDGRRIMLVVITARHWTQLLEATGLIDVVAALEKSLDLDFRIENTRYECRELLGGLLAQWFERRTHDRAVDALSATSVLSSTYRTLGEIVANDAAILAADPLFNQIDHEGIGQHYAAGSPIILDGVQVPAMVSPRVGQHTDDVLGEMLGFSTEKLDDLRTRGVIRVNS